MDRPDRLAIGKAPLLRWVGGRVHASRAGYGRGVGLLRMACRVPGLFRDDRELVAALTELMSPEADDLGTDTP
jgi:hypothetical protein